MEWYYLCLVMQMLNVSVKYAASVLRLCLMLSEVIQLLVVVVCIGWHAVCLYGYNQLFNTVSVNTEYSLMSWI